MKNFHLKSLFLIVMIVLFTFAQGADALAYFGIPSYLDTNGVTDIVKSADMNNDGYLDLIVSNKYHLGSPPAPSSVAVAFGSGDGTFYYTAVIPTSDHGPSGLTTADFNHDGFEDFVVANFGITGSNGSVDIGFNDGQGGFSVATLPNGERRPIGVAAGDFNGDGNPDLAVAYSSTKEVVVYTGHGDGNFDLAQRIRIYNIASLLRIASGDFNGDGAPDVATTSFDYAHVLLNLNDGTGSLWEYQRIGGLSTPIGGLEVADLNGDGALDLAVSSYSTGWTTNVAIYPGQGDGTFGDALPVDTGQYSFTYGIDSGDVNGDGIMDLGVTHSGYNDMAVMLGNGDFTFQEAIIYNLQNELGAGRFPRGFVFADLDGNGMPDAVAATPDSILPQRASVAILLNEYTAPVLSITGVDPAQGRMDEIQWVRITGTNFQDGATVMFGSDSAIMVEKWGEDLWALTPTALIPGPVDLTVTNPGGETATLPNGYEYTE